MLYHLHDVFNMSFFACPLFCIRNRLHSTELNAIEDLEERHRRLVESNIIEQCLNVHKTSVVQRRRLDTYFDKETKMSTPRIHPIVFDPQTGIIKSLKVWSLFIMLLLFVKQVVFGTKVLCVFSFCDRMTLRKI